MGGGTTDIAIFYDNIIYHTAVIPFGGNVITEDIRQGCSIIRKHAEEIKVKYGSALACENREDEVVSIPGIRGRAPKEISFKTLSNIIQARVSEIFDIVNDEIQKVNKEHTLVAGLVLTGGGALMKHIQQLAAYKTGLEVRIGYPNEYLNNETQGELASPICSTGIGLVLLGLDHYESELRRNNKASSNNDVKKPEDVVVEMPVKTKDGKLFSWGRKIITSFANKIMKDENIENEELDI